MQSISWLVLAHAALVGSASISVAQSPPPFNCADTVQAALGGFRIQRFFAHSLHGISGLAAGGFQGDTLVLDDNIILQGHPLLQQYRFTRPSEGQFTQLNRRSIDNGATWVVTLRATFSTGD